MSLRSEAAKVAAKLFEGIMKALGRASKEEAKAAAQLARRQAAGTGRIWRATPKTTVTQRVWRTESQATREATAKLREVWGKQGRSIEQQPAAMTRRAGEAEPRVWRREAGEKTVVDARPAPERRKTIEIPAPKTESTPTPRIVEISPVPARTREQTGTGRRIWRETPKRKVWRATQAEPKKPALQTN